jgi:hypothetical protein
MSVTKLHWLVCFACRYIQSTCATSGEGLYEGLDWLSSNIAKKVETQTCFVEASEFHGGFLLKVYIR